ncbi:peptidoglycan-binding protein [Devosia sp. FKR38]|uniref:peptidoglycan-binding protein n=1 Tax=Devosia sp. FKR38 TaxID=2562312 RepID=UPI0010C13162|nr:peptidoglycan-binding protein [Devosia sp. FKR38]
MARAYSVQDPSEHVSDPLPGDWQALRGELVALLDQVEGRYARVEEPDPALSGLSARVRNLRDQVVGPEPSIRRREALRTVKRAVDRFSDRDELARHDDEPDALTSAIAEIRGRQMSSSAAALGRRATDMPEFRELNALVGGLSGRLERLEGELKHQRTGSSSVQEVASQVEQLTHVVELLAGAVGETGQVKRLEAQIGALAALIEQGPKVDLTTINRRLDDVSTTVSKLAELQAQQMEREIIREERIAAQPRNDAAAPLLPAMEAIEHSVRNVYDRIDSIERNVALSSSDFERLTSEMAAFTQAMKNGQTAPEGLIYKVEALADRIGGFEAANGHVAGLKQDIEDLRDAVMSGMEPRFNRIETQIDALSERMVPAGDSVQVESQLKQLMARMDETSAQLNGLAKLYSKSGDSADLEAMATLVAERTSDALTRKAPAPVAMFGPDSLKSIEDRLTGLIKTAGKTPDYETLADLVAERTSRAVAKSALPAAPAERSGQDMDAFEERVTALLNTAGRDTAERLARLEAALTSRSDTLPTALAARPEPVAPKAPVEAVAPAAAAPSKPASAATPSGNRSDRLDAMLAALSRPKDDAHSDAMPKNPADDAPLIDPGFKEDGPVRSALAAKTGIMAPVASEPEAAPARPSFDPAAVQRPPRPQSSFAEPAASFAAPQPAPVAAPEAPVAQNSTSTFVAAARRAQRARTETVSEAVTGGSAISRALSRFMPDKSAAPSDPDAMPEAPAKPAKPAKAPRAEKPAKPARAAKPAPAVAAPSIGSGPLELSGNEPSFLTRYRRPLLLAAALVAVSMLALNLVMQRMSTDAPAAPAPVPTENTAPPLSSGEPTATDDVSLVRPQPRVIDMIDDTATASINPNASSFSRANIETTAMPPSLLADTAPNLAMTRSNGSAPVIAPETTGSIPDTVAATPTTFDLPPEAIGPEPLRQAAADGDSRAQFEVAAIYAEGQAIAQDYAQAAVWYERSAAQGFVPAQYRLGNLYETGTGVERDIEVAKLWYQRAADAGNRMAMHNLAALYAGGQLGEQAFETAAEWFNRAAARGMTDSQFNLGMLYARGLGVDQDFEQSYKWFALAARGGDVDAGKARDDIAKSLSADAVSKMGAEVAAWKAEPIDLAANFAPIGTWSADFSPGAPITQRETIAKVQQALSKLGFDVGTPDGVAGPKTTEAVKAFERGTGMSETGKINPRLLAVLGSQPV